MLRYELRVMAVVQDVKNSTWKSSYITVLLDGTSMLSDSNGIKLDTLPGVFEDRKRPVCALESPGPICSVGRLDQVWGRG